MTPPDADDPPATFGRPFLTAPVAAVPVLAPHTHADTGTEPDGDLIRPYFLTGGRVHQSDGAAGFETIYVRTADPDASGRALRTPEQEAILARCAEPLSVAELSAHLRLPIGVVLVLTGDLAAQGALSARTADPGVRHDLSIITRLIHAVHAL